MSDWDFLHEMKERGYSEQEIADAQTLISEIVRWYEPQFALNPPQSRKDPS